MTACGASGPLQHSLEEAGRPAEPGLAFDRPFLVVGRSATADLVLDHPDVSRRHAYLQLVDGRLLCVDLSPRGIRWDDGATRTGWLDPGRSALIGPYAIARLDAPEIASTPELARSPKGIILEMIDDPQGPPVRAYRIKQLLTIIGRSDSCHIPIDGPDVSSAHCSLVETTDGIWAVELLGKSGISVNGEPVRFARVEEGDVLQVGSQLLRFRLNPSQADPSTALATRSRRGTAPAPRHKPGAPALTPADAQTELAQAMMAPLMQQFSLMQQQMFDQFNQAMMGMFESIGGAYRDQMDDLRDELEEVRRITRELQSIQAEAATSRDDLTPDHVPAPDAETPVPRRPPPTRSDVSVHGILMERMARLQNERQTRWQSIIAKVNRTQG